MEKNYITANELIDMLGISRAKAYNLIRKMNSELKRESYPSGTTGSIRSV